MVDTVILRTVSSVTLVPGAPAAPIVVSETVNQSIVIKREGVRGLKGDRGDPGPPGLSGDAANSLNWTPPGASDIWNVVHNLNRFPAVTVVDSTNRVIEPDVEYLDMNVLTITFAFPVNGSAYLN